jgi:hypothetical protein
MKDEASANVVGTTKRSGKLIIGHPEKSTQQNLKCEEERLWSCALQAVYTVGFVIV